MSKYTFIQKVEDNRGRFKNQNRMHPILKNIYENGSSKLREQCTDFKLWGIHFIESLATELDKDEQDDFIKWFYEENTPSIHVVKAKFQSILMEK